jgi:two-component system nitrogen regulation sensor histidine kinase NtrY
MARLIAHEIKNPLTPIRLSAEHLREAWQRDRRHFEGVFDRCTDNILRQVEELRSIASDFSAYAQIPRIERQEGDLVTAVAAVAEAYRAAPPPGVEVRFRAGCERLVANFDPKLLPRAVRNLLENAIRASAERGRVDVVVERRDATAEITVSDQGPGVPPGQLRKVLEPYFSTHATGTGLGLPIAARIAEEHGGSLVARNRPTGGFEVVVTIPLA